MSMLYNQALNFPVSFTSTVSVNVTDFELLGVLVLPKLVVDDLNMLGVLILLADVSCLSMVELTDEIGVTVKSGLLKLRLSFGSPVCSRVSISAQVSSIKS